MSTRPRITVLATTSERHNRDTLPALAAALGITTERLATLRTSFIACASIDKTRPMHSRTDKTLFVAEVRAWLETELTVDDRVNIYGRQNLRYDPGYAVYLVATRFKHDANQPAIRPEHARLGPVTVAALGPERSDVGTSRTAARAGEKTVNQPGPARRKRKLACPVWARDRPRKRVGVSSDEPENSVRSAADEEFIDNVLALQNRKK